MTPDAEALAALKLATQTTAHDAKNALAPVVGFCELMLEDNDLLDQKDKVRLYIQLMHDGANDALACLVALRSHYSAP